MDLSLKGFLKQNYRSIICRRRFIKPWRHQIREHSSLQSCSSLDISPCGVLGRQTSTFRCWLSHVYFRWNPFILANAITGQICFFNISSIVVVIKNPIMHVKGCPRSGSQHLSFLYWFFFLVGKMSWHIFFWSQGLNPDPCCITSDCRGISQRDPCKNGQQDYRHRCQHLLRTAQDVQLTTEKSWHRDNWKNEKNLAKIGLLHIQP